MYKLETVQENETYEILWGLWDKKEKKVSTGGCRCCSRSYSENEKKSEKLDTYLDYGRKQKKKNDGIWRQWYQLQLENPDEIEKETGGTGYSI